MVATRSQLPRRSVAAGELPGSNRILTAARAPLFGSFWVEEAVAG